MARQQLPPGVRAYILHRPLWLPQDAWLAIKQWSVLSPTLDFFPRRRDQAFAFVPLGNTIDPA
jgi:hypothetical protein